MPADCPTCAGFGYIRRPTGAVDACPTCAASETIGGTAAPHVPSTAEQLRREAADLRAAATRLEAAADTIEAGP